ncbi:MAG: serine/threonine protein kinase [Verrucomicrobiales bacterium]|nr:serine/threonine protein kinase [Verrucomicrobiales bacterium]
MNEPNDSMLPSGNAPDSASLLFPEIPGYQIQGVLAQGGMGVVYYGVQVALGRPVAIKLTTAGAWGTELEAENSARFVEEARSMALLEHAGIVRVYDFGTTVDGQLFLVMELVQGANLERVLAERGTLPPAEAAAIAAHVSDALAYAHDHGLLHGDVKPANVLVDQQGGIHVADLGLCRALGQERGLGEVTLGTPGYAAPELFAAGSLVDGRADIYALGAMLYEMLIGSAPQFPGESPAAVQTSIPNALDAIVVKATQEDPAARFSTMREMRLALDAALDPKALLPGTRQPLLAGSSAPLPSSTRRSARPSLPIGSIFAALAVVALGIWALKFRQSAATESDRTATAASEAPTDALVVPMETSPQPTPMVDHSPPEPLPPNGPSAEIVRRLDDLEMHFSNALTSKADEPHDAALLQLTQGYQLALRKAADRAAKAGRPAEVAALRQEADRVELKPGVPENAAAEQTQGKLATLQNTYRAESQRLEVQRLRTVDQLFQTYLDTLASWLPELQAKSDAQSSLDAAEVDARRSEVADRRHTFVPPNRIAELEDAIASYEQQRQAATVAARQPSSPTAPPTPAQVDAPLRLRTRISSGKSDRLSKVEMFDDRALKLSFTVDVQNDEVARDLVGAKAKLVAFGRDVLDSKQFKVLSAENFTVDVPHQSSIRLEGKRFSAEYDDTGVALFGHKYHGYAFVITDTAGKVIYTAASPSSWGTHPEKIASLNTGAIVDRDLRTIE